MKESKKKEILSRMENISDIKYSMSEVKDLISDDEKRQKELESDI